VEKEIRVIVTKGPQADNDSTPLLLDPATMLITDASHH
jgi:hypothetical protein